MRFLNLLNPWFWYKSYRYWRATRRSLTVSEFAHKHRDFLVIVLDPVENTLYMSYRDKQVLNTIKTADGKTRHIVRDVLKASQFHRNIDYLITAIIEGLKTPLSNPAVNNFVKWVDGAVYVIAQSLKKKKMDKPN